MNRNRGFTLIELLVVIAIIAILAAILFPVFAQAKIAAKKAVSISNVKQLALGMFMYTNDVDDTFPKNHYQELGTTLISLKSGNPIANPDRTWTYVIQPYTKSYPIIRDPIMTEDPVGAWSGAPGGTGWYYNWTRWPGYGFNTTFLNPAPGCNPFGSTAANPGYEDFGPPIVTTTVGRPSQTVLFTTNKISGTSAGAYLSIDAEAPGGLYSSDSCDWSNGGWGSGSYGDVPGFFPGNPTYTGTFNIGYAAGGNVGWCDGSVKYQKPGALAAGTNWQVGATNLQIWPTDMSKYLWDYQTS